MSIRTTIINGETWISIEDYRTLERKITEADDRVYRASREREDARSERDYERQRRRDDEGVWLETRDANLRAQKQINDLKIALADSLRRPMGVLPDSATGLLTLEEIDAAEGRRCSL